MRHQDTEAFMKALPVSPGGKQHAIVVIDAPTSKPRLFGECIRIIADLQGNGTLSTFSLLTVCGRRLDLLATVSALISKHLKLTTFVIQCGTGRPQTMRLQPSYVLFSPAKGCQEAPAMIACNSVRASAQEGLRLRCTCRACPLRPETDCNTLTLFNIGGGWGVEPANNAKGTFSERPSGLG